MNFCGGVIDVPVSDLDRPAPYRQEPMHGARTTRTSGGFSLLKRLQKRFGPGEHAREAVADAHGIAGGRGSPSSTTSKCA